MVISNKVPVEYIKYVEQEVLLTCKVPESQANFKTQQALTGSAKQKEWMIKMNKNIKVLEQIN